MKEMEVMYRTTATFADAAQLLAVALTPMVEAIGNVVTEFDKTIKFCYQVAGEPYGPSDAGVERWLLEQCAVARERYDHDYAYVERWVVADAFARLHGLPPPQSPSYRLPA